jgi:hypothetical protein
MTRTKLIPIPAAGGRTVVLRPVPLGPCERLRALADRLLRRPAR